MSDLYGRLPCGKRVLEVLTRRNSDCGLISGLLVQPGKPAAGLDGHSRGRCSSPASGFARGCPSSIQLYPTRGPTALPSLHRLDSRTLCGVHSYCLGLIYAAAACAAPLPGLVLLPVPLVRTPMGHQRPGRACHLVGQRHHHHVQRPARQQSVASHLGLSLVCSITARAPWMSSVRRYGSPRLDDVPHAHLAAGAAVRRHQAQAGGELPPRAPGLAVAQRGRQRRRAEHADAGHLAQLARALSSCSCSAAISRSS